MPNTYWYRNCPVCEEGRLFVMCRMADASLYLQCDRCDAGWHDPASIADLDAGFPAEDIVGRPAELEDIFKAGWLKHEMHVEPE